MAEVASLRFVHTQSTVGYSMAKLVGLALQDVVLIWDEVRAD